MLWVQILSAILIGMMILVLAPRANQMLKHSPKPQQGDWQAVLLPIAAVVAFVILLVMLVN